MPIADIDRTSDPGFIRFLLPGFRARPSYRIMGARWKTGRVVSRYPIRLIDCNSVLSLRQSKDLPIVPASDCRLSLRVENVKPGRAHGDAPVSYTHLTLPTNREV